MLDLTLKHIKIFNEKKANLGFISMFKLLRNKCYGLDMVLSSFILLNTCFGYMHLLSPTPTDVRQQTVVLRRVDFKKIKGITGSSKRNVLNIENIFFFCEKNTC